METRLLSQIGILMLLTIPALAQLPRPVFDCDNVANEYFTKYTRTATILRELKIQDSTLIAEQKGRILSLQTAANSRIRDEGMLLGQARAKLDAVGKLTAKELLGTHWAKPGRRRALKRVLEATGYLE